VCELKRELLWVSAEWTTTTGAARRTTTASAVSGEPWSLSQRGCDPCCTTGVNCASGSAKLLERTHGLCLATVLPSLRMARPKAQWLKPPSKTLRLGSSSRGPSLKGPSSQDSSLPFYRNEVCMKCNEPSTGLTMSLQPGPPQFAEVIQRQITTTAIRSKMALRTIPG
jgi:hypothetical protein